MAKIRGTKPTVAQRKLLSKNNMNWNDWLFVENKTVEYDTDRTKSLGKNTVKSTYMKFVNRETGEIKIIE